MFNVPTGGRRLRPTERLHTFLHVREQSLVRKAQHIGLLRVLQRKLHTDQSIPKMLTLARCNDSQKLQSRCCVLGCCGCFSWMLQLLFGLLLDAHRTGYHNLICRESSPRARFVSHRNFRRNQGNDDDKNVICNEEYGIVNYFMRPSACALPALLHVPLLGSH